LELRPPAEWTQAAGPAEADSARDWTDAVLARFGVIDQTLLRPLLAAFSFYFVLCAFYWLLVPSAWLNDNHFIRELLPAFEWVYSHKWLALELAKQTLGFVVPLAAGMYCIQRDAPRGADMRQRSRQ